MCDAKVYVRKNRRPILCLIHLVANRKNPLTRDLYVFLYGVKMKTAVTFELQRLLC